MSSVVESFMSVPAPNRCVSLLEAKLYKRGEVDLLQRAFDQHTKTCALCFCLLEALPKWQLVAVLERPLNRSEEMRWDAWMRETSGEQLEAAR